MRSLITAKQKPKLMATRCLGRMTKTAGLEPTPKVPTTSMVLPHSAQLAGVQAMVLVQPRLETCSSTN